MKKLLGIFFSCSFLFVSAQNLEFSEKYSAYIDQADLKRNLTIFASDSFLGRETGKEGQRLAADFLCNYFKKLGCDFPPNMNSYEQFFQVIESSPGGVVSLNSQVFSFQKEFFYFGSKQRKTFQSTPVFSMNQLKIAEKEACFIAARFKGMDIRKEISALKSVLPKSAQGLILVAEDYETLLAYYDHYIKNKTMYLADAETKEEFPILILSESVAKQVMNKTNAYFFGKGKIKKSKINQALFHLDGLINEQQQLLTSSNVLAYIEGSDSLLSKELVVLTAHYDHIGVENGVVFNGADDDGTGSVALLEIAEAFMQAKKEGNGPKRSLLIMPVSGEEKGLLGSDFYTKNPVFPLENTIANLNIDMIGRNDIAHENDTNYIYIIGSNMLSDDLHRANEKANERSQVKLDYRFNSLSDPNQFYYRSDHYNFAKNNIPAIFYFSGVHEDYHQATDDVEKIIFPKVEKITQLVFYTAWELLNSPQRPQLNGH